MARTGRRPGRSGTREAILAAARSAFAQHGFDKASIRQIAAAAGVDPALVHHYFGSKDQLFVAALHFPIDPGTVLPDLLEGGPDGLGERLIRLFVSIWDSPAGTAGVALLRSALNHEWSAHMLRDFLTTQILRRIADALHLPDATLRLPLVASQLVGLAMIRYVLRLEPLAGAPVEWLVSVYGPTIQRYLTMPLPPAPDQDSATWKASPVEAAEPRES